MIRVGILTTKNLSFVRQALRLRGRALLGQGVALGKIEPRVPVTINVQREGVPSSSFQVTLQAESNNMLLAFYGPYAPRTQWFKRSAIFQTVIASAYELSEPRMGITRWPTISETASSFLFNVTEGNGGGGPSTVDATIQVGAAVQGEWKPREAVVVERMDDGQWRVAGYGRTSSDGFRALDLKVTTSGTIFAMSLDEYGTRFVPAQQVQVGQRVRPVVFTGWVYEITEPGVLPPAEPAWWPALGENPSRPLGTARAIAVRYYQPLAHGPLPVEIT